MGRNGQNWRVTGPGPIRWQCSVGRDLWPLFLFFIFRCWWLTHLPLWTIFMIPVFLSFDISPLLLLQIASHFRRPYTFDDPTFTVLRILVSLLAPHRHLHCWSFSRLFYPHFLPFRIRILHSCYLSRSLFLSFRHPPGKSPYFIVNIENSFFPSLYLLFLHYFTPPLPPPIPNPWEWGGGLWRASFLPSFLLSIFSGGRFYLLF